MNPAQGGTGLKIKTVEALAYGKPLVSTAIACEGLPTTSPDHLCTDFASVASRLARMVSGATDLEESSRQSCKVFSDYRFSVARTLRHFESIATLGEVTTRPKITIVTDIRYWRRSLGKESRLFNLIRVLDRYCDVQVFFLGSLWKAEIDAIRTSETPAQVFSAKDFQQTSNSSVEYIQRKLLGFEKKYFVREFAQSFEVFCAEKPAQVAIYEYIFLSYLRYVKNAPALNVLDCHDVMGLRQQTFERFDKQHFASISVADELEVMTGFDFVMAIQRQEYRYLARILGDHAVLYAPHFIEETPSMPRETDRGPIEIIFVGGNSPMNVDGLRWFLRYVWPAIAIWGPQLAVVGEVGTHFAHQKFAGVRFLGRVDDLTPHYRAADIAINPVFYGGGLKIKTVEAMSYGLPVLTTAEGARGIPLADPPAFIVAESRGDFIAELIRLSLNCELRDQLSARARALVRTEYGYSYSENFADLIKKVALA